MKNAKAIEMKGVIVPRRRDCLDSDGGTHLSYVLENRSDWCADMSEEREKLSFSMHP